MPTRGNILRTFSLFWLGEIILYGLLPSGLSTLRQISPSSPSLPPVSLACTVLFYKKGSQSFLENPPASVVYFMPSPPRFVFGDHPSRPSNKNSVVAHILRDVFSIQGFVTIGVGIQALSTYCLPAPYNNIPGLCIFLSAMVPWLLRKIGIPKKDEDAGVIVGKTAAFLDFADPIHAGKEPGEIAVSGPAEAQPKLALMLIGSRCFTRMGSLELEYKGMGDVIAQMIEELRDAPPEDDTGFLNAENYVHAKDITGNGNMIAIYWRSYQHIWKFAHKADGTHYPAWARFMNLQKDSPKFGSKIGVWHEIYEISNAEGIYHNVPRMGLGNMWDAVRTEDNQIVYRNSLVTGTGIYASSNGRLGYPESQKYQDRWR